jgi:signal transduction histidine kinase
VQHEGARQGVGLKRPRRRPVSLRPEEWVDVEADDLRALGEDVAAALALGAVAAGGQQHDRRDGRDGEQAAAAVAHELLAPLSGLRLRLAPLAFAAQGFLLTLASGH